VGERGKNRSGEGKVRGNVRDPTRQKKNKGGKRYLLPASVGREDK